jgi:acyl-CoA synthetase (NDP forming)
MSELLPTHVRERLLEQGVVPLQGLEDGLYAYAAAARYQSFRDERMASMSLPRSAPEETDQPGVAATFDELQSKQHLAEYGLTVPAGLACSVADAADVAETVGFPVVLKALGEKFLHKSDLGAVKLNLSNAAAVAHAVSEITSSAGESGQEVARFLVEPMTTDAVAELIVGVKRDEQFGPALVIGSGGILVELVADSVSLLLPTNRDEVRGAILNLLVARLLDGYRGSPRGDMEALIDAILAVADYAEAHWDVLEELDVNPLLVLPEGEGVVAVDAMIVHR